MGENPIEGKSDVCVEEIGKEKGTEPHVVIAAKAVRLSAVIS